MYKVTVQTTNGIIETQIEKIEDLGNLIAQYYEIYTGFRLENQEKTMKLERK